ncbi:Ran-specific GTPase-activating protein 30 [Elsinoe australis]|uniref:Ran-specific GTPase-activating protein 30 n=1 Tax=Elsinoe australis TaxID=40998 RepID=A0A2P8AFP7_9PEZI|nr:Ran-specific GTPase-activating protein 30 [Elsinoe australis]
MTNTRPVQGQLPTAEVNTNSESECTPGRFQVWPFHESTNLQKQERFLRNFSDTLQVTLLCHPDHTLTAPDRERKAHHKRGLKMIEKQRTRQIHITDSLDYAQCKGWAISLSKFFGETEPEEQWVLHLSLGTRDSPILFDATWAFDMQRKVRRESLRG